MKPSLPEKYSTNQWYLYQYLLVLREAIDTGTYENLAIWAADETFYAKVYKAFLDDSWMWPIGNLPSAKER